jgi:hypothetical protein
MTASATAPPGIPHASERTRRLLDFDCPLLSNVNAHAQALSMGATRTFLSTNPNQSKLRFQGIHQGV